MAICLVQEREEVQVFHHTPGGGETGRLYGLDCVLFEKFLWILKRYPLRLEVSAAIVAVTDFVQVSFHIADCGIIPEKTFLVLPLKDMNFLSYQNIIALVGKNTPAS